MGMKIDGHYMSNLKTRSIFFVMQNYMPGGFCYVSVLVRDSVRVHIRKHTANPLYNFGFSSLAAGDVGSGCAETQGTMTSFSLSH